MKKIVVFLYVFTFLGIEMINAQQTYVCDFENAAENAEWVLNAGPMGQRIVNKWHIGSAINNGGSNSLYISDDYGQTAHYGNAGTTIIAYRHLDLAPGEYELSFDWLAGSAGGSDVLFVACMDTTIGNYSAVLAARPDYLDEYGLIPEGGTSDSLASAWWQTSVFSIEIPQGIPQKLVFIWCNRGGKPSNAKGACIDNICIYPKDRCEAPTNMDIYTTGTSVIVKWDGNADSYDAKYYSYETNRWSESTVHTDSIVFQNMTEGVYNFYVRSNCGDDEVSHWVNHSQLVYLPDTRCIDYLTLTDRNCFTGNASGGSATISTPGKVDYGSDSKESRHTIHMVPGEYDARTDYMLPTIPDGELASVRLGNWESGSKAEKITYDFTVDTLESAVLLLKYAVVLEEPENHNEDQMPRFMIRVLNTNGASLDVNKCAEATFSAGFGTTDATWHESSGTSTKTIWKEWTTIGINLRDYHGQRLKIEVSTYDCSLGAHYGYAYFVLGCNTGEIEGIACGGDPTTHFEAPDGFNYEWYLPSDPSNILGTEQIFNVDPMDTLTYFCDVISKAAGKEMCYYTLQASAIPNHPVPEATFTARVENCQNIVAFSHTSHIMTVNQITTDSVHTLRPCDDVLWDFGDGTTSTEPYPEHTFPQEGGTYNVKLTAYYSYCDSTINIPITLPDLGTLYDTIPLFGCLGSSVMLPNGLTAWSDGFYLDTLHSHFGCDSILVYDVHFFEEINIEIFDTICTDESILFDGEYRNETGQYVQQGISIYGCDSIITLNLLVNEKVQGEISSNPIVCSGENEVQVDINVLSGVPDFVDILFTERNTNKAWENIKANYDAGILYITLPQSIRPDDYSMLVVLGDQECGSDTIPLEISVLYPDSIIVQRWDDMLSVKNDRWNGGYTFSSYQWYKDGQPMSGQTGSYLYVPEEKLDTESEYSVLLTRADDNVAVMTCPFVPQTISEDERTKLVISIDNLSYNSLEVEVAQPAQIKVYNTLGLKIHESSTENHAEVPLPTSSGMYIIEITGDDGQRETYRTIVK